MSKSTKFENVRKMYLMSICFYLASW